MGPKFQTQISSAEETLQLFEENADSFIFNEENGISQDQYNKVKSFCFKDSEKKY